MELFDKIRWILYGVGFLLAIAGGVLVWEHMYTTAGEIIAVIGFLMFTASGYLVRIRQGSVAYKWLEKKMGKSEDSIDAPPTNP
jgi:hypothetical protein